MTQDREANQGGEIIVRVDAGISSIVPVFLENRRIDIKSLVEALEQGDYETVRILGHSMKGSGGGYGFDAVSEIGTALEQAAQEKDSQAAREWVNELATYLGRVKVVYV